MDGEQPRVTARVVTPAPLLRRGLERAALAAGFAVVDIGAASVTLRPDGATAPGDEGVDVAVQHDRVVVTVRRAVDVPTVLKLQTLLVELLDPS